MQAARSAVRYTIRSAPDDAVLPRFGQVAAELGGSDNRKLAISMHRDGMVVKQRGFSESQICRE